MSMNKVILIGRLTKDPVTRQIVSTGRSVSTFYLAVNRNYAKAREEGIADFIPVVIWGKQAEAIGKYAKKGKLVSVAGKIQVRSYKLEDNATKYVTEVIADDVQFLEPKKKEEIAEVV